MGLKNRIEIGNKELFRKINALHFTDEVIINKPNNAKAISKVMNSINRKGKVVEKTDFGDKILLKRLRPFNMNVRYRKR